MSAPSSIAVRRKRAVESFKTAADCIGTIEEGAALFAITRGQFSMIDAENQSRSCFRADAKQNPDGAQCVIEQTMRFR